MARFIRRLARWGIPAAVGVVILALLVPRFGAWQEDSYWYWHRDQYRISEVRLVQWHPTRPVMLGDVTYSHLRGGHGVQRRVAIFGTDGSCRFLSEHERDRPYGWSPDGNRILLLRQRHLTVGDLDRRARYPGAPPEEDDFHAALCVMDADGAVQTVARLEGRRCERATWLGQNRIAAVICTRSPFRLVLEVRQLSPPWVRVSDPFGEENPFLLPLALIVGPQGQMAAPCMVIYTAPRGRGARVASGPRAGSAGPASPHPPFSSVLYWKDPLGPCRELDLPREADLVWWRRPEPRRSLMLPPIAGYDFRGEEVSVGPAIAVVCRRHRHDEDDELIAVWRRGWAKARILHRGAQLWSLLPSPDGQKLGFVEAGTKVRVVDVPQQ